MVTRRGLRAKGNRAEREIVHIMKGWGYEAVGSKASLGAADVVAWNNERIKLIQSKNSERMSSYPEDIDKLRKLKCPPNGTRELWIRQRGGFWIRKIIMPDGSVSHEVLEK